MGEFYDNFSRNRIIVGLVKMVTRKLITACKMEK